MTGSEDTELPVLLLGIRVDQCPHTRLFALYLDGKDFRSLRHLDNQVVSGIELKLPNRVHWSDGFATLY